MMTKVRRASALLIVVIMSLAVLLPLVPASAQDGGVDLPYLIVNVGALNIRTGPGVEYASIGVLNGGQSYNIEGISPDRIWFYIVGTSYGDGWVRGRHTIFRGDIDAVPVINGPYGELSASTFYVNIRIPVYDAPRGVELGYVPGGVEYAAVGRDFVGDWIQIQTPQYGAAWARFASGVFRGYYFNLPIDPGTVPQFGDTDPILYVNVEALNLRAGPGANYAVLGVLTGGNSYSVTGVSPDQIWFYIVGTPYGDGWVRGRHTTFRGDIDAVPELGPDYYGALQGAVFYVSIYIPVYDKPGGNALGLIPGRAQYAISGRSSGGGWVRLETSMYGTVWTQYSRGFFQGSWVNLPIIYPPYE
ncbi:MAG: hypothetical protein GYB66_16015 [Chloroflexi bacterium]|nr:hypothetical protein [Chloroflexota bacterium]